MPWPSVRTSPWPAELQTKHKDLETMRTWFDDNICPVALDEIHPVDSRDSWRKRKRREDFHTPAANEDQLKTNTHAIQKGGRP